MPQYVLLLRDDPAQFSGLSPEEMQAVIKKYGDWRVSLQSKLVGGNKLRDGEGRVLSGHNVTDGPFAEAQEVMGGFFILEADSYDDAVAIAKTCPHMDHGSIEIRAIERNLPRP